MRCISPGRFIPTTASCGAHPVRKEKNGSWRKRRFWRSPSQANWAMSALGSFFQASIRRVNWHFRPRTSRPRSSIMFPLIVRLRRLSLPGNAGLFARNCSISSTGSSPALLLAFRTTPAPWRATDALPKRTPAKELTEHLPWTLLRDIDPDERPQFFDEESFVCVLAEVALDAPTPEAFFRRAVDFANERLAGTLCAAVTHPAGFRSQPSNERLLQACLDELRYGVSRHQPLARPDVRDDEPSLGWISRQQAGRCTERNWLGPQHLHAGGRGEIGSRRTADDLPEATVVPQPCASRRCGLVVFPIVRPAFVEEPGPAPVCFVDFLIRYCLRRRVDGIPSRRNRHRTGIRGQPRLLCHHRTTRRCAV